MISGDKTIEVHGHRGCRGLMHENSIPAFIKATEMGVEALELDIVVTADAQVLVSHEAWFAAGYCLKPDGTTINPSEEKQHNIYKLPFATIKQYDCSLKPNPRFPHQQKVAVHKPLLSEVIEAVRNYSSAKGIAEPYFNIEIKSFPEGDNIFHPEPGEFVNLLLQVLENYNLTATVMVQSFDVRPLQVLHKLAPTIKLGLLTEDDTPPQQRLQQLGFKPYAYNPNYSLVDAALMALLRAEDIRIFAWTVNEEETVQKMLDYGVDGIITDYPDMVQQMLRNTDISNKNFV